MKVRRAVKILVVEDDATMRAMLSYNLENAGYDIIEAADGRAALQAVVEDRPDLVVLDLMIPQIDGVTICREIRRRNATLPIIMVTALGTEKDRLRGFEAGADDYVTKPFSMEELLARIKANLRRARGESATERLIYGDLAIDVKNHIVEVAGADISLRTKEFQLLVLLAGSPGRLFSRQEIAERIWGYDFLGESRTIDVHIKNIRQRLEEGSAYRFIETVRGMGYRFKMRPRSQST